MGVAVATWYSLDLSEDAASTWAAECVSEVPEEGRVMDHRVPGEKSSGTKPDKSQGEKPTGLQGLC